MYKCGVIWLFALYVGGYLAKVECIGISSKLDFGGDETTTKNHTSTINSGFVKTIVNLSHSVTSNKANGGAVASFNPRPGTFDFKTISVPKQYAGSSNSKESKEFEQIGVVCTSGNCNKVDLNKESVDTISTDIHVHVETSIGKEKTNQSQTSLEGDDDVPIIVGYGGASGHDSPPLEADYNDKPDYVSKINYNSNSNNNKHHTDTRLNPEALVISSLDPSFQFNRRVEGIPGIISIVDSNQAETPKLSGASKIHIVPDYSKFEKKPGNEEKFKANGIELQISYFEPSFNNHYFGENAPPQIVWYPKHGNTFNPHSFKVNTNPTWTYSAFTTVRPTVVGHPLTTSGWKSQQSCTCSNPALHWYPSQTWQPHQPPGASISDKLNFNDQS